MSWAELVALAALVATALPLLGAIVVARAATHDRARSIAVLVTGAAALVSLVGAGPRAHGLLVAPGWLGHVAVDGLSAVLLPATALATFAMLLAAPREAMSRREMSRVLVTLGAALALVTTMHLVVLVVAWLGAVLPGYAEARARRGADHHVTRVYAIYHVALSLPLVVGAAALSLLALRQGLDPFDVAAITAHGLAPSHRVPVALAFGVSALARMGVAPFHSWLPVLVERGSRSMLVPLLGGSAGVVVVVRLMLPLAPEVVESPLLAGLALFSAAYGAVLAVGQRDVRRALAFLAVSQAGLVLVGLASANVQTVTGAVVLRVSGTVSLAGLLLVSGLVASRAGGDLRGGGLVRSLPRLTALFALFALASVGAPGTLGFVAEDLLVQGVFHAHPVVGAVLLATIALAAVATVRIVVRGFFGPRAPARPAVLAHDARPRELAAAAVLLAGLVGTGLSPARLLGRTGAFRGAGLDARAHASSAATP